MKCCRAEELRNLYISRYAVIKHSYMYIFAPTYPDLHRSHLVFARWFLSCLAGHFLAKNDPSTRRSVPSFATLEKDLPLALGPSNTPIYRLSLALEVGNIAHVVSLIGGSSVPYAKIEP